MWPSVASHALTFIFGFAAAVFMCECKHNRPDKKLPPLK